MNSTHQVDAAKDVPPMLSAKEGASLDTVGPDALGDEAVLPESLWTRIE